MTPILFISSYVGLGGGETDLLTLATALAEADYVPHLLLPYDGQLGSAWRENGWPLHITPWRGATVYFVPWLWARLPLVARFTAIMRQQGIRIVHSDYHSLPMAVPAARRAGLPLLWTCWGWWFHPKPWQRGWFSGLDAIFARSRAIKEGFLGHPPFMPPERVELVYSGVDTDRFHPHVDGIRVRWEAGVPQSAPLVAMIARFQDVKGHDVFQAMARQVALQIPDAHFIVAGESVHNVSAEDAYKRRILETAAQDPLLRQLKYIGFRADAERVIGAADVVVCASDFESYGRVNVEAMACAKPVVSTNRGGPSETIVDGETGFLVPPRDPMRMAEAVIRLLRDPDLRHRMGQAGRARALAHFSVGAMAAPYQRLFRYWLGKG